MQCMPAVKVHHSGTPSPADYLVAQTSAVNHSSTWCCLSDMCNGRYCPAAGGVDDLLLALLSAHPTLRAIHGVGSTRDAKTNKTRATVTISLADGSRKTVRRPAGYALGPFTTWGGESKGGGG